MLDIFFWILVGAFVGWNVDRPFWSIYVQKKVLSLFSKEEK